MRSPLPRARTALLLVSALLCACATQDRLTADAINCSVSDVQIVPSRYSQQGSKTAWCATCKGKRYQCATNAERSRVVCQPSREGDGCL
jgi:hypothetical protein